MYRIASSLLFGLALISVSACSDMAGNTAATSKTSLTTSCAVEVDRLTGDWLEGYPDCDAPGAVPSGQSHTTVEAPAP